MRLAADLTLVGQRFENGRVIDVDGGRIAGIRSLAPRVAQSADVVRLPGKALLPGTVNTHCHTFQSLLRGLGDDLDFMQWRDRVLYPFSTRLDRDGIYVGAAFAFTEMKDKGIVIGLGTDGGCTNNRLSVFEEMRMAALLQKVRHLNGTRLPAEQAFAMGTIDGGRLLRLPVGDVAPGMEADLVAIDLAHPSLHPPTQLLKNVVYAMSPQAVTDVWVRGRQVVRNQRLTTLDQDGLMERVRALTRDWALA